MCVCVCVRVCACACVCVCAWMSVKEPSKIRMEATLSPENAACILFYVAKVFIMAVLFLCF